MKSNLLIKSFLLIGFLSFVPVAFADNTALLSESIGVGKTLSVGLNPGSTGAWHIVSVSNASAVSAYILSDSLVVSGKAPGSTAILACSNPQNTDCLNVNVTVNSVLGVFLSAHPVKSWIIKNGTVYYVSGSGLIGVPTWKIFLQNKGKASLIVQANEADMNLPQLPVMAPYDSRVK